MTNKLVYLLHGNSKKLSLVNVKLCEDVYDHMAFIRSKKHKRKTTKIFIKRVVK